MQKEIKMKRIIFTLMLVISSTAILAQTYNMKIIQGKASTYSGTSTVDSITFYNTATTPFVCGNVLLYGGETYQTVSIGSQCWFQKNLNIGIRTDLSSGQIDNSIIEKYCYNDLDANCVTYGGLYQWNEAMQYSIIEGSQGICPNGWHIPTYTELQTLASVVNNDGNKLKALGQGTGSGSGTNTSGFSALLAGISSSGVGFFSLSNSAYIWSSTEQETIYAYALFLYFTNSGPGWPYTDQAHGFSVRCLKN